MKELSADDALSPDDERASDKDEDELNPDDERERPDCDDDGVARSDCNGGDMMGCLTSLSETCVMIEGTTLL